MHYDVIERAYGVWTLMCCAALRWWGNSKNGWIKKWRKLELAIFAFGNNMAVVRYHHVVFKGWRSPTYRQNEWSNQKREMNKKTAGFDWTIFIHTVCSHGCRYNNRCSGMTFVCVISVHSFRIHNPFGIAILAAIFVFRNLRECIASIFCIISNARSQFNSGKVLHFENDWRNRNESF